MSVTDIPQTGLVPATLAESMDGDSLGGLVSLDSITHFVWRRHESFGLFPNGVLLLFCNSCGLQLFLPGISYYVFTFAEVLSV